MEQPKAIISNRIYFKSPSPEYTEYLVKQLTYRIQDKKSKGTKRNMVFVETIRNYKLLPRDIVSVPQTRMDLIPENYTIEDRRVLHPVPFPDPLFPLRPGQQEVYDKVEDNCFVNAKVGWGKTFTALNIARKLGQKTLVVTHTTMLRDQWCEEAEKLYNMPIGKIGSDVFDIEDHAIVIGNIQTVTKRIKDIEKEFGLVILDEAHHVPAATFSRLLDGMHSRYKIGLSGTIQRTDGKQVIFKDYFGSVMFKPEQEGTIDPVVKIIKTGIALSSHLPWAQKINELLYDQGYQQFISALAKSQMMQGHSVLVIADRVEFLNNVKENIGADCVLITGETSYDERKKLIEQVETTKGMSVAGSRAIFSEGISINRLSCVIIATPTSNEISLEQIIGRIMRQHPEKQTPPLVLDLVFNSPSERKQAQARLKFYLEKGWDIQYV